MDDFMESEKPEEKAKEDEFEDFGKAWDEEFTCQKMSEKKVESKEDISLPIITNEAGDKIMRFYWWDASEDAHRQPGAVTLYGKVQLEKPKKFVSCCLVVKNIQKRIYVLPREFVRILTKAEICVLDVKHSC